MQKIEHVGFVEAVERLADRVGTPSPTPAAATSVQRDRGTRTRLVEANAAAAEFYAEQLESAEAAPARQFLTERGFDADGRPALRLRLRPVGLGLAHQAPAAQGVLLRRAGSRGSVPAGPARPDRPLPPQAAVADPRPRRARWSASGRGGCSTTIASRPSTSTPPRRRSTRSRRRCSGSTWPSARSPSGARSSSSRATPT